MTLPRTPAAPVPAPPSDVVGGSHGMAAAYSQLRALAAAYDLEGDLLRDRVGTSARILADGDLVESALLSPVSFAEAEAAVLAVSAGPDGLVVASLAWETDAVLVRVTVAAFEATDRLVHASIEAIDYSLGRAVGFTLSAGLIGTLASAPVWLPPIALTAGGAWAGYELLPAPLQDRLRDGAGEVSADLAADIQAWLIDHPGAVEHLANAAGGLVDGFWDGLTPGVPLGPLGIPLFTPSAEAAGQLLAGLYPADGDPVVAERPDLAPPSGLGTVPGSLADVMAHLDGVNTWSAEGHPENNGTIEIQSWTGPDGVRHHIVYLPGTDDMATLPWTMDGDVRDMPTNFLAVNGQSTAYAQGILQAMHQAGIGADDPVLLAGHSQGGIEAAWIATHTSDFHVTQVVTAGSPIGVMGDYPPGTQVLSLEHHGDVIPLVEGESNPDTVNHVTVTFDDHEASIGGNHAIPHYVNGAAGVDASTHPSLVDHISGMHEQGFLTGQTAQVDTHAYQITRQPDGRP